MDFHRISYYPFGMVMEDREYTSASYRYGFNGMEKDDEVKGDGNSVDFGARIYDSRIGRFLSIDPKALEYGFWSGYLFAGSTPIMAIDVNGENIYIITGGKKYDINDPQLQEVASPQLLKALNHLMATPSGQQLLKDFATGEQSKTTDIYI